MKKGILAVATFAIAMVVSMAGVNATTDYKDSDLESLVDNSVETIKVEAGDTLELNDGNNGTSKLIGNTGEYYITIAEGDSNYVTIEYSDGAFVVTLYGEATINAGTRYIMEGYYNGKVPIYLTISGDAILTVEGTLVVPSNTQGEITNNGTLIVEETGALELRAKSTYEATAGTTNVYGSLVIYTDTTNSPSINVNTINLYAKATIYSQLNDEIDFINYDEDEYELVTTDGVTYNSWGGEATFTTYTLSELTSVEVEDDNDDTVLGDTATNTTDTTTDVETEEEVENPQTFDAVSLYATTAVVSVGALVGAVIYLKRKNA